MGGNLWAPPQGLPTPLLALLVPLVMTSHCPVCEDRKKTAPCTNQQTSPPRLLIQYVRSQVCFTIKFSLSLILVVITSYCARSSTKVHKNENFFGSDFEICTISLLVILKYYGFVKKIFIGPLWKEVWLPRPRRHSGGAVPAHTTATREEERQCAATRAAVPEAPTVVRSEEKQKTNRKSV